MSTAISVITPSFDRFETVIACISSVLASDPVSDGALEVIVVSCGYTEQQVAQIEGLGVQVRLLTAKTLVSATRNAGAEFAHGKYLLFLDDDNVVAPDAIRLLYEALCSSPEVAMVGPAMYYSSPASRLWCAGVHRSRLFMRTRFVDRLPDPLPPRLGSEDFPNCFLVSRDSFQLVHGFDARRFPCHYEEADLARRIVAATRGQVFCVPAARIWHQIDGDLARRLHLKDKESAYWCGRSKAVFTSLYGNLLQRILYIAAGHWLYAAIYLAAIRRLPSAERRGIGSTYVRGLRDGWRYFWSRERGKGPNVSD